MSEFALGRVDMVLHELMATIFSVLLSALHGEFLRQLPM